MKRWLKDFSLSFLIISGTIGVIGLVAVASVAALNFLQALTGDIVGTMILFGFFLAMFLSAVVASEQ